MEELLRPSRLHPSEACRVPLSLTAPEGGRVDLSNQPGIPVLLAEWQSEDGQATDLEFMIAPDWGPNPAHLPDQYFQPWVYTMAYVHWGLSIEHGRGRTASGQEYRTPWSVPSGGAGAPVSRPGPDIRIRAAGHKGRIAATRAQLWVWFASSLNLPAIPIVGSFAPAIGPMQIIPAADANDDNPENAKAFPIGATEWRVRRAGLGGEGVPVTAEIREEGPIGYLCRTWLLADLADWQPIDRPALLWRCTEAWPLLADYK